MKRRACFFSAYMVLLLLLVITVGCGERDFQGGVRFTLEVRADVLVEQLASDRGDTLFYETLDAARARTAGGQHAFAEVFAQEFEQRAPEMRLTRYFRDDDAGLTRRSSNAEVVQYLRQEVDEAVRAAVEVIRKRVDRFSPRGLFSRGYFVQRQGAQRIIVKIRQLDDPERFSRLLRSGSLEFRRMADPDDLQRSLQQIINYYEGLPVVIERDEEGVSNRLLDVLDIGQGVVFGRVSERDSSAFNALIADPKVQAMLPRDIELFYTAHPVYTAEGEAFFDVLGVETTPELTGAVITDARIDVDSQTNEPLVSMTMNSEGSRTWARVTGTSVGKNIAIVFNGVVYSYPRVIQKIVGGRSQITGLDSREEAVDIVAVLKSGALPTPVDVVGYEPNID